MQTTTINVPLIIPQALIDEGAIELYAIKLAGWTPTIQKDVVDVVGNVTGQETIPNPVSAQDAGIAYVQNVVKNEYRTIMVNLGIEQGRDQALAQFNSLFPQS